MLFINVVYLLFNGSEQPVVDVVKNGTHRRLNTMNMKGFCYQVNYI
jgi:hypothetical protein